MDVRNESIGGYGFPGFGGYGSGYGGGGLLGIIALLALFRGNLGEGRYGDASGCLNQIQAQLGNIQGQIGETQYNNISSMMNQTIGLMESINCGKLENLNALFNQTMHFDQELKCCEKSICEVDKDVLTNRFEAAKEAWKVDSDVLNNRFILSKEIEQQGFANQINNLNQTIQLKDQLCAMQHSADMCCCKTNEHIDQTVFATQLRDLEYKNCTDRQLEELKCGQKAIMGEIRESRYLDENIRLRDKVDCLREKDERHHLSREIACAANKNLNMTRGLWSADRMFNGTDFPNPPFTTTFCGCGGCGCE